MLFDIRGAVDVGDRLGIEFGRRTVEHELTVFEADDAIGELNGIIDLMEVHQTRDAQIWDRGSQWAHRQG